MRDITIIDFHDSFTYNIQCEVESLGISSEVITYTELPKIAPELLRMQNKHVVLFGPGPGHPEDYQSYHPHIKMLLGQKNLFHMGICLGHQLMWYLNGVGIRRSINPIHGQSVPVDFASWPQQLPSDHRELIIPVQRYNSLIVDLTPRTARLYHQNHRFIFHQNECMASFGQHWLTYQFHPESIGTSCRDIFFGPVKNFLYTERDGKDEIQTRRHL